jgi:hypothetical protein
MADETLDRTTDTPDEENAQVADTEVIPTEEPRKRPQVGVPPQPVPDSIVFVQPPPVV